MASMLPGLCLVLLCAQLGLGARVLSQGTAGSRLGTAEKLLVGPPLCDSQIVAESCRAIDLDNSKGDTASVFELSTLMSASRSSTVAFLRAINVDVARAPANVQVVSGGEDFSCAELCAQVVEAVHPDALPPYSDVGCRASPENPEEKTCDIDLSPNAFSSIKMPAKMHGEAKQPGKPAQHPGGQPDLSIAGHAIKLGGVQRENVTVQDAIIRVANLFRVYPRLPTTFIDSENGGHVDSQAHSLLDSSDSDHETTEGASYTQKQQRPEWYAGVEKTNVVAQAYVANALRLTVRDTKWINYWFGSAGRTAHDEVLRVLNSVDKLLTNVAYSYGKKCQKYVMAYVYPNSNMTQTKSGQYRFFLCDEYFKSDLGEQIETLTHEGSHHGPAFTQDVCLTGTAGKCQEVAYGRRKCRQLAETNSTKALQNADSYCFYINDLNGHKQKWEH